MKLKMKMLLLTLFALGLLAPASASATETWWYDHQETSWPTVTAKKAITPLSGLSITLGAARLGPCEHSFTGSIWNVTGGMGEGELTGASEDENCATSIPGCTVLKSKVLNTPWSLTLTTSKLVKISGFKIEMQLSPGCAPLTSPTTFTGTVEGQFVASTATTPTTVQFNSTPGLTTGKVGATLDGYIQFGTKITALPEPPEH